MESHPQPLRRRRLVVATSLGLALLLPALPGSAAGEIWPMYGHDASHQGNSDVFGPSAPRPHEWSFDLGVRAQDNAGPVIGPDGTIYVSSEAKFFAINPDGTLKWSKWGTGSFDTTMTRQAPAVASDGTVYVWKGADVSKDDWWPGGALYALDPTDGSEIWHYVVGSATYGSPTVGPDGTIYIGAGPHMESSRLYALNPNGTLKWMWNSNSTCWIESSPALGPNGNVYVNHNCRGLVALSSTGSFLWQRSSLGQVWNSPAVGPDGTIYIATSSYWFHAVRPSDGKTKWRVPVDAWMYEAAPSMIASGRTIFQGDNGGVFYGIDASGRRRWSFDTGTGAQIASAPAVSGNGVVYFTIGDDTGLFALRTSDGKLLWKADTGGSSSSPAVGSDGTVYALGGDSDSAVLYAFGCGEDLSGNGVGDTCEDRTPPDTTIDSSPSSPTRDHTPKFTFSADEDGMVFQCRMDSDPFSACTSPWIPQWIADGQHKFYVRGVDEVGNSDPTPASRLFKIDTTPPRTKIFAGPLGKTKDRSPTFKFRSNETRSEFQCRRDGSPWKACKSPKTYRRLGFGQHVFKARAIDRAGNVDPSPAKRSFKVVR